MDSTAVTVQSIQINDMKIQFNGWPCRMLLRDFHSISYTLECVIYLMSWVETLLQRKFHVRVCVFINFSSSLGEIPLFDVELVRHLTNMQCKYGFNFVIFGKLRWHWFLKVKPRHKTPARTDEKVFGFIHITSWKHQFWTTQIKQCKQNTKKNKRRDKPL